MRPTEANWKNIAWNAPQIIMIFVAAFSIAGCQQYKELAGDNEYIYNNSDTNTHQVIDILRFNNTLCKKNDGLGVGISSDKISGISDTCLGKHYPRCTSWRFQYIDMQCVMDTVKPVYDAEIKVQTDRRNSEILRQQQAEKSEKEHMRQLQLEYENSPQGIADKQRIIAENNATIEVCNKVIDTYADTNLFEVISRSEYRKIGNSRFSCMAVFKRGYDVYPIIVTYDSKSGRYIATPL